MEVEVRHDKEAPSNSFGLTIHSNRNEMKFFAETTKRKSDPNKTNVLIMGRKTWAGIPESRRPLPGRVNIVLSRNPDTSAYPKSVLVCKSLEEAIAATEEGDLQGKVESVWIIGGGSVYKEAMESPSCDKLYLTEVKKIFECDAFFPGVPKDFQEVEGDEHVPKGVQEEDGLQYEYKVYQKGNK